MGTWHRLSACDNDHSVESLLKISWRKVDLNLKDHQKCGLLPVLFDESPRNPAVVIVAAATCQEEGTSSGLLRRRREAIRDRWELRFVVMERPLKVRVDITDPNWIIEVGSCLGKMYN